MLTFLALAAGFLAGGFARWGAASLIVARAGANFPWGTAAVNLSGCLLVGFFDGAARAKGLPPLARLALITGFCGAYTTFSSLIMETSALLNAGRWGAAGLHYLGGGLLGLLLFRLGTSAARFL